jgi:hypothetical protein
MPSVVLSTSRRAKRPSRRRVLLPHRNREGRQRSLFSPRRLKQSEPSRDRHRPDRTMRIRDQVLMVTEWLRSANYPANLTHSLCKASGATWAERVARLLPRGRLRVVSGEPHAVHYTQPELVAGLVRELVIQEGQQASRQLRATRRPRSGRRARGGPSPSSGRDDVAVANRVQIWREPTA